MEIDKTIGYKKKKISLDIDERIDTILEDLSIVLSSCMIIDNELERRTYPSAGARYPLKFILSHSM